MKPVIRIAVAAGLVLSLGAGSTFAQSRLTMQWEAMAERLVAQLAPEPGERILLVARPGQFDELIPPLRYALLRAGAVDLGVIDVIEEPYPEDWDADLLAEGTAAARAVYREMLRDFDGAIMLPGARPDHAVYAALQDCCTRASAAPSTSTGPRTAARFPCRGSRCRRRRSSTPRINTRCSRPTTRGWRRFSGASWTRCAGPKCG